mgnify:CR=1 FL=1
MKKERHIHKIKDHFLSKEFFSLEYDVKTEVLKTKPKPATKQPLKQKLKSIMIL